MRQTALAIVPYQDALKNTRLRYAALHADFDGRGFVQREREFGYPAERTFYVGVRLSLNEVLFETGLPRTLRSTMTRTRCPHGPSRRPSSMFKCSTRTAAYGGTRFSTIRR